MKQKKNKKRWIYNIAILFFLGVMIFSLWNLIPLLIQDHRDNETQKEMVQMVEKNRKMIKPLRWSPIGRNYRKAIRTSSDGSMSRIRSSIIRSYKARIILIISIIPR